MNNLPQSKMLIIFNICQIKFQNYKSEPGGQVEYWCKSINSILNQDYKNHTIVISGCVISPIAKKQLRDTFGDKVCYNFMDEIYTVNITSNKSADKMIEHYGEYDGYVWVDSGVHCIGHSNVLSEINIRSQTKKYGLIYVETETDFGWDMTLGPGIASHDFNGEDFIQPIGTILVAHFAYYSNEMRKIYGKILPDVFEVGGTEFITPYMCYAAKLKPVVIRDLKLYHAMGFDGSSSGFNTAIGQMGFLYGLKAEDVVLNDEVKNSGVGYDDLPWGPHCLHVPHKKEAFNEEGFAKNPEMMQQCIKNHFFLNPSRFDYNSIKCEFIPNT